MLRATITLVEASHVPASDVSTGKADPYVVCMVKGSNIVHKTEKDHGQSAPSMESII